MQRTTIVAVLCVCVSPPPGAACGGLARGCLYQGAPYSCHNRVAVAALRAAGWRAPAELPLTAFRGTINDGGGARLCPGCHNNQLASCKTLDGYLLSSPVRSLTPSCIKVQCSLFYAFYAYLCYCETGSTWQMSTYRPYDQRLRRGKLTRRRRSWPMLRPQWSGLTPTPQQSCGTQSSCNHDVARLSRAPSPHGSLRIQLRSAS